MPGATAMDDEGTCPPPQLMLTVAHGVDGSMKQTALCPAVTLKREKLHTVSMPTRLQVPTWSCTMPANWFWPLVPDKSKASKTNHASEASCLSVHMSPTAAREGGL